MTIASATSPAASQAADPGSASKSQLARSKLSETYDNFLKLLTTQLQNQDPLNPMDSTEFTNQLVLYSQVEQQIGQNEKLEKLLQNQASSLELGVLGYIGLDVEVKGNRFTLADDGKAAFAYTLPEAAHAVQIRILDEDGKTVRLLEGTKTAGRHEVTWDGKNANDTHLPAGNYTFAVAALDAQSKPIRTDDTVFGRVTGIDRQGGETSILIGDAALGVDQIRSARKPSITTN